MWDKRVLALSRLGSTPFKQVKKRGGLHGCISCAVVAKGLFD
jgi:hypothetical protein